MKKIANILLWFWFALLLLYPIAYFCVKSLSQATGPWKISMLHVGLAPWTVGIFGIVVLLFWWATHRRKNWFDLLTFAGLSALGITVLLVVSALVIPFSR